MDNENREPSLRGALIIGGSLSGIGCTIPILIVIAIFAGRWLDDRLGTKPWILLGLLLGSITLGMVMMATTAISAGKKAQSRFLADRRRIRNISNYPHDIHEEDNR